MSDNGAPDRIWVGKYHGTWWQSRPHHQMTEYVRADLHAALQAERDRLRRLVERAYREGYTDGYHTSNPHKDIAGDWAKSDARRATQEAAE